MNNLAPSSIFDVTSTPDVPGSTSTTTWKVTFAAAMGSVPEMTIGDGNADLSSVSANVVIATVTVCRMLFRDTSKTLYNKHLSFM